MRADEEQRAAAYRVQVARRQAWERANERRLAGSSVAARDLRVAWQPLIDHFNDRERELGDYREQDR